MIYKEEPGFSDIIHKHITDSDFEQWVHLRQPYVATFELTPKCNFQCIHCYLGTHRQDNSELTYEQVIHILDELEKAGVLQLALTGGECTLRKDFCKIYKYAKQKGFLVTVFTNASNITKEILSVFQEYPPFTLEISLYGASECTYHRITKRKLFHRVISNLNELYANGINFTLKTPLMKQNYKDLNSMSQIAERLKRKLVMGFVMSPTIDQELYPTELALDLVTRFKHEIESNKGEDTNPEIAEVENPWGEIFDKGEFVPQFICNPGVTDVFVDYHGRVCPCIAYRCKGISLLEHDFQEIWDKFSYFKKIPVMKENKCMRCDSRYFCSICLGDQENVYHDINHVPEDVCTYARARKMYYKDHESPEIIIEFIKREITPK